MLGLTKTTGYAVLAMACLPDPGGEPVPVASVSDRTGIHRPYLGKLMQTLSEAGLLDTRRGSGGGALLARPAPSITIAEIVEAIEGPGSMDACLLGRADCGDERTCPAHHFWKPMREEIQVHLSTLTLRDVADFERRQGMLSDRFGRTF